MSIVVSTEARIRDIRISDDTITADLADGRVISVPLAWSWRLSDATSAQRRNFRIIGDGRGVHWPDIDEDISAEGMLHGIPARRPMASVLERGLGSETPANNQALQPTSRAQQKRKQKRRARATRG